MTSADLENQQLGQAIIEDSVPTSTRYLVLASVPTPPVGMLRLATTMLTLAVVLLPAASRAMALKVCVALVVVVVSQLMLYGATVSSAPRLRPSNWNCTPITPTLSEAVAETVIVPLIAALAAGAVNEIVGGVVSGTGLLTVTTTADDVV